MEWELLRCLTDQKFRPSILPCRGIDTQLLLRSSSLLCTVGKADHFGPAALPPSGVAGRASRLPKADSLRASGGTSTPVPSRTVSVRAGRRVVVGVVNGRKGVSDLDGIGVGPRRIELKLILPPFLDEKSQSSGP